MVAALELLRFKFLREALLNDKLRYLHVLNNVRQAVGKMFLNDHFLGAENCLDVALHTRIVQEKT